MKNELYNASANEQARDNCARNSIEDNYLNHRKNVSIGYSSDGLFFDKKRKIIVVNADFGMGGISKSAIEWLNLIDYSQFDITLYIRRNDAVELLSFVSDKVNIITIDSKLKNGVFDDSFVGKTIKIACALLKKIGSNYLAKQLYRWYMYPRQRKEEGAKLSGLVYDVAIAYSTADDIPIFVLNEIKADKKYLFIHQSTPFSKENQSSLPRFDSVVAVSDVLCDKLKKDFTGKKIKFVSLPNYVSHKNINEMAKKEAIGDNSDVIKFATCGRLVDVKGYDTLIEAACLLRDNGLRFKWNWIGDGACRQKMEKLIKDNDLEDYVFVLGEKINPYPYIAACDIYVQPSRAEAYPLAILESITLGKVVVSTRTVGGCNILNKYNCGKLVDFSSKELAETLLSFSLNKELLKREQEKVKQIDWQKEEECYINNWHQLLCGEV